MITISRQQKRVESETNIVGIQKKQHVNVNQITNENWCQLHAKLHLSCLSFCLEKIMYKTEMLIDTFQNISLQTIIVCNRINFAIILPFVYNFVEIKHEEMSENVESSSESWQQPKMKIKSRKKNRYK